MEVEKALEHAQRLNVFTPFGLQLPAKLTEVDYYCIGVQLVLAEDSVGWGRADLASRMKQDFPNSYMDRWKELFRETVATLENDSRTAGRYSVEERKRWIEGGLSYSHCRIVSHFPDEERESLLLTCVERGWKVWQLEEHLYGKGQRTRPSRDVKYQERCSKWLKSIPREEAMIAEPYVRSYSEWLESQS